MFLAGHEIVEQHIAVGLPALTRGDKIGAGRVGVVADVDVEGQVGDLARILGPAVAHFVGEPHVRRMRRVLGRGVRPRFAVRECLPVCYCFLFVLCIRGRVRSPIGMPRSGGGCRLRGRIGNLDCWLDNDLTWVGS